MVAIKAGARSIASTVDPARRSSPVPGRDGARGDDELIDPLEAFKGSALEWPVVRAVNAVLKSHGLDGISELEALPETLRKAIMAEVGQTVQRVIGSPRAKGDGVNKSAWPATAGPLRRPRPAQSPPASAKRRKGPRAGNARPENGMLLTTLVVPTMTQMLRALSGLLDKAEAQRPGQAGSALFSQRLAPDMYALAAQIRFVCLQAQEPVYRLQGEPIPERLKQLAREDLARPTSFDQARSLIADALSLLHSVGSRQFDAGERRRIVIQCPDGMTFDLTGEQYVRDWALPHFYFHLVTAYAILRRAGIGLGKGDYVPHMAAYLRDAGSAAIS